jgi:hypothetical protein|tara:strand:+ start:70 stop:357 length:288 start_codon:yes stop_codon:yes gene_type:complete
MNTLTIPTPSLSSTTATGEVVLDVAEITFAKQENTTTTIIYTNSITKGTVTLTHGAASDGSVGNAVNHALLKSNGGNSVVAMPSGISITNVAYAV